MRPAVLVVGMANSIHVARWLELLVDLPFDFELISSNPSTKIHSKIETLLEMPVGEKPMSLHVTWVSRNLSIYMWLADRFFKDWIRASFIALRILATRPELVHVLELQNGGYPTRKAFSVLPKRIRPKLFVTNYGSDVYWYQNFPDHVLQLQSLLGLADAFSAECERDVEIAKGLGFNKLILKTCPVTGGIDTKLIPRGGLAVPLSQRKSIAVKGYQGEWGQAREAIEALLLTDLEILKDFKVELYSCDAETVESAQALSDLGVEVSTTNKGELSHESMLELFRRSRLYIGLSTSDGISTSMLEAMSQGAVPIQTNTSCANEWIKRDSQGFVVALGSPQSISTAIEQILRDDAFVFRAQEENFNVIAENYDREKIKQVMESYYKDLLPREVIG